MNGIYHDGTNLVLSSTSKDTKTKIVMGASAYDEANERLGLKTQAPSADLSLGGEADFTIKQEREATADAAGRHTTLQAGGAKSGSTDKAGGNLTLASGIATGTGDSKVLVKTAAPGSTGTTDSNPATVAEFRGTGDVVLGRQAQLAQNATVGFLMVPSVATGDPSGTPAAVPAGMCAITFVPATGKLAVWDGSAWKLFTADA